MNLFWFLYGLSVLLALNANSEGKRTHGAHKKDKRLQSKRNSIKGKGVIKKLDLGSKDKDDSSEVTKRQFMYRPYDMANYPILKPPPIRHFVVHHHAS